MYDYLKDYVFKNIWCTPDQDNQLILRPKRITPNGGVLRVHKVMWRKIAMPDTTSTWHVYQVGQVHPLILGLLPKTSEWTTFAAACNAQKMICDIYAGTGIQFPKFDTYYMYNEDRDLIIAVKQNARILFNFDTDNLFLRVYSNAYFDSSRANATLDLIKVIGATCITTQDVTALQTQYNTWAAKSGACLAFVNGVKVTAIDLIQMHPGDTGEFVYDSSVIKTVEFKIQDLKEFTSIRDSKVKYLLHYTGADQQTIDFRDDIDIYVIDPIGNGKHRGLYYHKNNVDALRNVTHRDYAIPTAYITPYKTPLEAVSPAGRNINPQDLYVRLYIRKSGYLRPLVNEHSRIADLYKMSDTNIVRAMVGVDSTVEVWRAENLENSDYIRMMGLKAKDITPTQVQNGLGYNAISKVIGDTPKKTYTFSGQKMIDVPYGLQYRSTAYEYDNTGKMIGWYLHQNGSRYICTNSSAFMVEMISGTGSNKPGDRRGINVLDVDIAQSYRVYKNETDSAGVPTDWVDVTGTGQYVVVAGKMQRTDGLTSGKFIVRDEKTFLAYDLSIPMTSGELRFALRMLTKRTSGLYVDTTMEVPMDQLDIFLNGKPLICGLDYILKFPEIAIVNKEFLNDPLHVAQKIHVRATGYCDTAMKFRPVEDVGFIDHGVLSNNNKYDIRDDKVVRVVVAGSLKCREDIIFSELHSGVSITNVLNGKPYSVQDRVVPLKWLTVQPTFTVRARSKLVDKAVGDYLTLKIPQPPRDGLSVINARYKLFSPFICRMIYDMLNNTFIMAGLDQNYSDDFVALRCAAYLPLLPTDPTQQTQQVNTNFVIVHPHNLDTVIDLNVYQYRFVERAIKLYANNVVTLSPFVRIATT